MKNLFLSLILLVLGACTGIPTKTPSKMGKNTSLTNTHWILEDNSTSNEITLFVESDKVSGNASCNDYFGGLTTDVSSGTFKIDKIGATRKACPKMSAEQYFLSVLEKVDRYYATNETLELYEGNVLLLKFKKK